MGERWEAARASFRGVQLRLLGEEDVPVGEGTTEAAREGKGSEAEKRKENAMSDEVWPGAAQRHWPRCGEGAEGNRRRRTEIWEKWKRRENRSKNNNGNAKR